MTGNNPNIEKERDELIKALHKTKGNVTELARQLRTGRRTLGDKLVRMGIDAGAIRAEYEAPKMDLSKVTGEEPGPHDDILLTALTKSKSTTLLELCDLVGMPPSPVLEIIKRLHTSGYRVPSPGEVLRYGKVHLETDQESPYKESHNEFDLDFEGDTYITATISDPHLSSQHEQPEYLEAAYDMIAELGITEVYHGGDNSCGMGIYKGQINEVKHVRIDDQIDHAVKVYPRREGITTRAIAGNHDLEGVAGRIGVNPMKAFCERRDDFEYLGEYSAWFNLPNGAKVQLLHPMGGMSYAMSYRLQKHIESYTESEKPDILWCAHYHKSLYMPGIRNMHAFLLGTFEGGSMLATRRGLGEPGLGFWVHKITMKPRGIVQYTPTWYDFLDGVPDLITD